MTDPTGPTVPEPGPATGQSYLVAGPAPLLDAVTAVLTALPGATVRPTAAADGTTERLTATMPAETADALRALSPDLVVEPDDLLWS